MNTYQTTEIANIIDIHPNTVRLYEQLGLVPEAKRKENGYRVFTDFHIEQFRLARAALKVEILQNGLRKKAINIIKTSATGDFDKALEFTSDYLIQLQKEKFNAEEAIKIVEELLAGKNQSNKLLLKRKEVSDYLDITMDTLRNWELNGLLRIKRKSNGYRVYTEDDLRRLRVIRALRCANYSLSSILRMLNAININPDVNIKEVIGMPEESDDIITACDKLLLSLHDAKENAEFMRRTLERMKKVYK